MFRALFAWVLLFSFSLPTQVQTPQLSQVSEGLIVLKEKEVMSREDIIVNARNVARRKGISEELFIRILLDESGASSTIIGKIKDKPRKGCRDRGVWQINSCWWPEITDEQAFDPLWSTKWAGERFKEGR